MYHYKSIKAQELANCKQIDDIDRESQYHIGHPIIISNTDGTMKVKFVHGGKSLNVINYKTVNPKRFLRGLCTIFYGICDMNSRGYYHLDVKSSNITMDKNYTFKLIDFGLSGRSKKSVMFETVYGVWPCEVILLSTIDKASLRDIYIERYQKDKYVKEYYQGKNSADINKNVIELLLLDDDSLYLEIYKKIDVYSFGISLWQFIKLLNLDKGLKEELLALSHDMTNYSTLKRIDSRMALDRYRKILSKYGI